MKTGSTLFAAAVLLTHIVAAPLSGSSRPTDDDIRRILVDRIDTQHEGVGIVVGTIDDAGRRVVSYGRFDPADPRPVDGGTVFEIGSTTKVFTSLLLADAVERGEVALDDPVSKYLPPDVVMPERAGRKITLQDLASHVSGLPSLPTNLAPTNPANPYADYTASQLYAFLSSYRLTRDIGVRYEYSNLGAGLLGHALARRAGTDYETLVKTRITAPLGMNDTALALNEGQQARFAPGHNATRERVPNWDIPTLAGAGALRSTANDLLTFLAANLGYVQTPLAPAMAAMLTTRRPTGAPALDIGLAWHILKTPEIGDLVWHNGGTGGYRAFMAFSPRSRAGVVVLSNMFTDKGVDDIGLHLLDPALPLLQSGSQRKEVTVAPEVLERYVGRYELAPTFVIAVTREGDRLFIQATGQGKLEVFPSSAREFFVKVVDARITFEADERGNVTGLTLHQNGANQHARRIE